MLKHDQNLHSELICLPLVRVSDDAFKYYAFNLTEHFFYCSCPIRVTREGGELRVPTTPFTRLLKIQVQQCHQGQIQLIHY